MRNDTKSSLSLDLMQAILQTDEWDHIWAQDAAIQAARFKLETVMEAVKSKELRDSLLNATFGLTTACETAAIRYGSRVTLRGGGPIPFLDMEPADADPLIDTPVLTHPSLEAALQNFCSARPLDLGTT